MDCGVSFCVFSSSLTLQSSLSLSLLLSGASLVPDSASKANIHYLFVVRKSTESLFTWLLVLGRWKTISFSLYFPTSIALLLLPEACSNSVPWFQNHLKNVSPLHMFSIILPPLRIFVVYTSPSLSSNFFLSWNSRLEDLV